MLIYNFCVALTRSNKFKFLESIDNDDNDDDDDDDDDDEAGVKLGTFNSVATSFVSHPRFLLGRRSTMICFFLNLAKIFNFFFLDSDNICTRTTFLRCISYLELHKLDKNISFLAM